MKVKLELPFPPSTNDYWKKYRNRIVINDDGREYRQAVDLFATIARSNGDAPKEPMDGILSVKCWLYPPTAHRRDIDNFDSKCLWDALTKAGIWHDDSQVKHRESWMMDGSYFGEKPGKPGKVVVEIEVLR